MFRFEGCVNKPRVGKIKITIIKNQKILKNLNFTPDLSFFAEFRLIEQYSESVGDSQHLF